METKEPVVEAPAVEAPAADPAPTESKAPTVAEALAPKPEAADVVPLATFLEVKKEAKEVPGLRARITELEKKVTEGAPRAEVSDDIAAIGKEFDVNSDFLSKLTGAITAKVAKEADARVEAGLAPQKERERADALDKAFRTHFDAAIEQMPEFAKIAKPEVIKTLSLDPNNANKTFAQIIEDTYGDAIQGKRTIEPTRPGGPKEPSEIDYTRASKDSEYFAEVMANPATKKAYNDGLAKRLKL